MGRETRAIPAVSVVIPAFNYGRFVTEAVDSVLAQTMAPREIIVVDDGSTDDTRQRLSRYASRVKYVHQANQGLSAARNTGIRQSASDWIAFLDADDLWHPEKLDVEFGAVSGLDGIRFFGSARAAEWPAQVPHDARARRLGVRDFLCWMPLSGSSAVVHRSCFDEIGGFDEGLRSVEDRDMWLRLVVRYPSAAVEAGCWWYREHPQQMNRNAARMHQNYVRVLTRFFRDHPQPRSLERLGWSFLLYDASYSHFAEGDRRAAAIFLVRSLWRCPRAFSGGPSRRRARLKLGIRLALGERIWARRPGGRRSTGSGT